MTVTKLCVFNATRDGKPIGEFTVDMAKLSEAMLYKAASRGITESIRNTWASIKASDPKACELSLDAGLDWVKRLEEGEDVFSGGGGQRIDPLTKHLRVVLTDWLHRKHGLSMTDAIKAAKDGKAIVEHYASIKAESTGGNATELAEKAWAHFTSIAQRRVDEAANQETVEL